MSRFYLKILRKVACCGRVEFDKNRLFIELALPQMSQFEKKNFVTGAMQSRLGGSLMVIYKST